MEIQRISTGSAPAPSGPYSQAIKAGSLVFCAGQIAIDPKTNSLTGSSIEDQTRQCLANLAEVLRACGSSFEKVVKTTVYLKDLGDFAAMNKEYEKSFPKTPPARTTMEVPRLPRDAKIEIDAVAVV